MIRSRLHLGTLESPNCTHALILMADVETDTVLIDRFIFRPLSILMLWSAHSTSTPNTMTAALATATMKLANVQRAARARGEQHGRPGVMNIENDGDPAVHALSGKECFHCKRTGHFRDRCPFRSYPREEAQRRAAQGQGPPRGGGGGRGRGGRGRGSGGRGRGSSRGSSGGYGGYGGSQRGRGRGGLFRGHDQRLVGAIAEALDQALSLPTEPQGGEATTDDVGQEGGQPQQGGQMLQGN